MTIATTTYAEKKMKNFRYGGILFLKPFSLQEIFVLDVFVFYENSNGYD